MNDVKGAIRLGIALLMQSLADDADALRAIDRPGLRKAIVRHVVGFDAEGVLDDLGGAGVCRCG